MKEIDSVVFASYKRSFTVFITFCIFCAVTVNAQTFTIFPGTGNDPIVSAQGNDGQGIEVGIKFKVTQIGTISAIRFYKYSGQSNGAFTASLWSNGNATTPGTRLSTASATMNGAGWTQI